MKYQIKGQKNENSKLKEFVDYLDNLKSNPKFYYEGMTVEIDPTVDYNTNTVLIRWTDVKSGFNDKEIMSFDKFKNVFKLKKTTREKALLWWNNLPDFGKGGFFGKDELTTKFYGSRVLYSLTGREIEYIWRNFKSK